MMARLILVACWRRPGHGLGMKRFNVYAFGAQPDESDIEETAEGEWVKWEDANARAAELLSELDAERERTAEERTLRIADTADANARVAELETQFAAGLKRWDEDVAAANARADSAETDLQITVNQRDRAESEAAALRAEVKTALELNDALRDVANAALAKVDRCKAVLSRRYSEPGHWENPAGELCSADELETALEDK